MGKCVVHHIGAGADLAPGVGDIKLSARDLETESGGRWLACDGRNLRQAEYPELFRAAGYRYGAPDGKRVCALDEEKIKAALAGAVGVNLRFVYHIDRDHLGLVVESWTSTVSNPSRYVSILALTISTGAYQVLKKDFDSVGGGSYRFSSTYTVTGGYGYLFGVICTEKSTSASYMAYRWPVTENPAGFAVVSAGGVGVSAGENSPYPYINSVVVIDGVLVGLTKFSNKAHMVQADFTAKSMKLVYENAYTSEQYLVLCGYGAYFTEKTNLRLSFVDMKGAVTACQVPEGAVKGSLEYALCAGDRCVLGFPGASAPFGGVRAAMYTRQAPTTPQPCPYAAPDQIGLTLRLWTQRGAAGVGSAVTTDEGEVYARFESLQWSSDAALNGNAPGRAQAKDTLLLVDGAGRLYPVAYPKINNEYVPVGGGLYMSGPWEVSTYLEYFRLPKMVDSMRVIVDGSYCYSASVGRNAYIRAR